MIAICAADQFIPVHLLTDLSVSIMMYLLCSDLLMRKCSGIFLPSSKPKLFGGRML